MFSGSDSSGSTLPHNQNRIFFMFIRSSSLKVEEELPDLFNNSEMFDASVMRLSSVNLSFVIGDVAASWNESVAPIEEILLLQLSIFCPMFWQLRFAGEVDSDESDSWIVE